MNKTLLKKFIREELQRECGMAPAPPAEATPKDHSMGSQEGESVMAKGTLHKAIQSAQEIDAILGDDVDLPEWLEAKLTTAADYLGMAKDYLSYKGERGMMPQPELPIAGES